jgi:hypothetical protein
MPAIQIVDVTNEASFALMPPCADPGFDHRSCDYWENADRGSKAARSSWLEGRATPEPPPKPTSGNPFLDDLAEPAFNPFASSGGSTLADNPFAQATSARAAVGSEAPPKLGLLARGLLVFGSYAKILTVDRQPAAYAQFGPLSAYPRASRLRDLYPQLPESPLPAVITCIATTGEARRQGYARQLIAAVCDDLAGRGFAAVEAYPESGTREDATSSATPAFWVASGFVMAVADERFPVMRREL